MFTPQEGIEDIKNNPQVFTTQEGIEEIKNNPQVYTTQEGKEEIKNNQQVFTTQEGVDTAVSQWKFSSCMQSTGNMELIISFLVNAK